MTRRMFQLATLVDCPARADDRHIGSSSGAATGLTLGVGHRPVTDRLARHGLIPKHDVTKPRALKTNARAHFFQPKDLVVAPIKATVPPPRRLHFDDT